MIYFTESEISVAQMYVDRVWLIYQGPNLEESFLSTNSHQCLSSSARCSSLHTQTIHTPLSHTHSSDTYTNLGIHTYHTNALTYKHAHILHTHTHIQSELCCSIKQSLMSSWTTLHENKMWTDCIVQRLSTLHPSYEFSLHECNVILTVSHTFLEVTSQGLSELRTCVIIYGIYICFPI